MARFATWLLLASSLALAAACGPPRPARIEGALAGDVGFAITNLTSVPIIVVDMGQGYDILNLDLDRKGDPIQPGQTARLALRPGEYRVTLLGRAAGRQLLFQEEHLRLNRPTQIVVHDGERPPAYAALDGFSVVTRERFDTVYERQRAADQAARAARARQARAECERRSAPLPPAPGKVKATGKWRCVLGGAYTGTDYVDLVQLVDGHITATLTGSDRNATWTGSVVGDEVRFQFAGNAADGGTLKLDPSGRAMVGNGVTFTDRGECTQWTMTCTR
jgi:hypothetical protein